MPPYRPIDGNGDETEEYRPEQAEAHAAGCQLYVTTGTPKTQGLVLRLESGTSIIGRDPECGLVLDDPNVSRQHAQVRLVPDGILVEDLGSTNGIWYLDKRIERAVLNLGSRIAIGPCQIDLLPLSENQLLPISRKDHYGGLVGASMPMRRLYSVLELLEQSDAPVLIEGETGTGKELVARALHGRGPRANDPFVVIDCGNIPVELMEAELFGHRKGAFTGATSDRAGAFEEADGGTVLLDELGELPLPLQPKLLRVLETGQVKRVGEARHHTVGVRIIAATQRDLAKAVSLGHFREDLYYRVAVVKIQLPPLRDRREDIPLLAQHLARQVTREPEDLPPSVIEQLMHHDWPGNVRELRNVIQRALTLRRANGEVLPPFGSWLDASGVTASSRGSGLSRVRPVTFKEARALTMLEFERSYLKQLLNLSMGNLSEASRIAAIDRKHLRTLLKKHELV